MQAEMNRDVISAPCLTYVVLLRMSLVRQKYLKHKTQNTLEYMGIAHSQHFLTKCLSTLYPP